MQEVFEKIIERLEKQRYSENLNLRWEAMRIDKAIQIVNEVAEEYNNGWISVEERLPNDSEGTICCLVTCKSVDNEELEIKCAYFNKGFSDGWVSLYDVTAWQPLPEPYQPKGDKE